MTCINKRDTITQSAGEALPNYQIEDAVTRSTGGHIQASITSHCRVDGGMWVAWIQNVEGDGIDAYGTSAYGDDQNKVDWPSLIASANVYRAGYFPDDGSPSTIYELAIDPIYYWNDVGGSVPSDHCSHFPLVGDTYANDGKSQLTGWAMNPIDLQIRTDGTNVWVIALACESVKYPYLWNNPAEIDDCGHGHPNFEDDWAAGHDNPFFHDDDAGNDWWLYQRGAIGGDAPFGDYDDPGWDQSFRWQPARVTVWGGDLGGFSRLDTLEAQFDNFTSNEGGLSSGIECAASPAEPGVLHVLWAEGGNAARRPNDMRGQRISYSRWDASGKTLDTDVRSALELGSGYVNDDIFVWTAEMILRNDHGSPIAIVWPWVCAGGPQFVSPAAEYWDLSGGTANVVQTLNSTLIPTEAETGMPNPNEVFGIAVGSDLISEGTGFMLTRSQYASSLYTDTRLSDTDVYLIAVGYSPKAGPEKGAVGFYRIPCDGSDTFSFMDGIRRVWYSIIPNSGLSVFLPGTAITIDAWATYFQHDFVSDPDNVWMPLAADVVHLDRQCAQLWEVLEAFPGDTDPDHSGFDTGYFTDATSPPPLVTFDDGDWLLGGGFGPHLRVTAFDPSYVASLKAKICRCCLPCLNHVGLHIWDKV